MMKMETENVTRRLRRGAPAALASDRSGSGGAPIIVGFAGIFGNKLARCITIVKIAVLSRFKHDLMRIG